MIQPTEHAPHCPGPDWEFQPQLWPGTAIRGRCRNCGAVTIQRADRARTRTRKGGDAA